MTRPIRIARFASDELAAAIHWYEHERVGLGGEFLDAIDRAIRRIAEHPDAGSSIGEFDARRLLVKGFPFQVVYRLSHDEIRIIAVAHLKRRPGSWRDRR